MMLLLDRLITLPLLLPKPLGRTLLNLPMLWSLPIPELVRRFVRRRRRLMGAALTMASMMKRRVVRRTVLK
ncbi:hypothetical protein ANAPRD1_00902 [Anaplasma phagocytophilum]|uniref:p44 outer membrane protein, silent n=1 Tax=Anaplasma phagocytophilum TaxID=948 RepID=A0A098EEN4_ANAPH|nr:P44 outer membrane protein, silent [Anaplasma phagocytophilum]SCV65677.1 hypothetical protein ANAPRD1_00902 [Anaplasma phagocytophilum]